MSGKLAIPRCRVNRRAAAVESNPECRVCIHRAAGQPGRSCCRQGCWQCRTRGMVVGLPDRMRGTPGWSVCRKFGKAADRADRKQVVVGQ